jgi:hypothetical protein
MEPERADAGIQRADDVGVPGIADQSTPRSRRSRAVRVRRERFRERASHGAPSAVHRSTGAASTLLRDHGAIKVILAVPNQAMPELLSQSGLDGRGKRLPQHL